MDRLWVSVSLLYWALGLISLVGGAWYWRAGQEVIRAEIPDAHGPKRCLRAYRSNWLTAVGVVMAAKDIGVSILCMWRFLIYLHVARYGGGIVSVAERYEFFPFGMGALAGWIAFWNSILLVIVAGGVVPICQSRLTWIAIGAGVIWLPIAWVLVSAVGGAE